jgi:hypothetical protein
VVRCGCACDVIMYYVMCDVDTRSGHWTHAVDIYIIIERG